MPRVITYNLKPRYVLFAAWRSSAQNLCRTSRASGQWAGGASEGGAHMPVIGLGVESKGHLNYLRAIHPISQERNSRSARLDRRGLRPAAFGWRMADVGGRGVA